MRAEPGADGSPGDVPPAGPPRDATRDDTRDVARAVAHDVPHGASESPPALHDMPGDIPAEVPDGMHHEMVPTVALEFPPASAVAAADAPPAAPAPPPAILPVVDVDWLDWDATRVAVDPGALRARMRTIVERMESLLDREDGPMLLFDEHRDHPGDRAIHVTHIDDAVPLWFIGDLHGDLLALEAALALARPANDSGPRARLVFLGDLFDDGGYGLETLLRFFELVADDPESVCLIAGNHDEALGYDGSRFTATVSPSDFSELLNANLAHEWITRAGKLAVRLIARAPRALFLPDGLLVAHGGFPLVDLHAGLLERQDWNDPRCLTDFVWSRAHAKARRKMPNRTTRGSQFGYEDFAAFCEVAAQVGRPVTHMVRGHDHVDDRWAVYPAYSAHPMLTTVALSRQLAREAYGPYERVPTVARWTRDALPQVFRLMVPGEIVRELYPETVEPHS